MRGVRNRTKIKCVRKIPVIQYKGVDNDVLPRCDVVHTCVLYGSLVAVMSVFDPSSLCDLVVTFLICCRLPL